MTLAATLEEIETWPIAQRLELVERIWASIPANGELPLSTELEAELDSRLDAYEANPQQTIPWNDVKAYVRRNKS